jgi:hypothetical protein
MTQQEIEAFITGLDAVETSENFGYKFFFVGHERMLPFATIADRDSEYDNKSNLDRDGVFRINIGVSKATFDKLVGQIPVDGCDFTQLNVFLPHPDYAKQHFICILSPTGEQLRRTHSLLEEAHGIALARQQRKEKQKKPNAT